MRKSWTPLLVGIAALSVGLLAPARAQIGYPMIKSCYPVGAQRGQTVKVAISGHYNMWGASKVYFDGTGVEGTVDPIAKPKNLKEGQYPNVNSITLTIKVAPDAALGPREFRIFTPRGLSTVGQMVIGDLPEMVEKEPNGKAEQALAVQAPVTLNGRIGAKEDLDYYKFSVKAGQQMAFSVISARLQDKIHDLRPGGGGTHSDPIISLLDASGRELASNDDYYHQDPLLIYKFKQDGEYFIVIRDVRYDGNAEWPYRMTVTGAPYLTGIYPMAGQRGTQVKVAPVGSSVSGMAASTIAVPNDMQGDRMTVQLQGPGGKSNPMPFIVSDDPQVLESDANDTPDGALMVTLPAGLNGRVEKTNDLDFFAFQAVKDRYYTFEVFSRRLMTSLDSEIAITNAEGRVLTENDDAVGKDSRLDWKAPADGAYYLRITDLHRRGGPTFIYHIAAREATPDFTLRSDDDKAIIGPGAGYVMYVRVTRRNGFTGEVKLHTEGVPPGVTATSGFIPSYMTESTVVFNAQPNAKPDFSRIRIWGTSVYKDNEGKEQPLSVDAVAYSEIYSPGGGRTHFAVDTHMVSIMEADQNDLVLKLSSNKLTLKPGGTASIDVEVIRSERFQAANKDVVLDVYLRHLNRKHGNPLPPGVELDESASKTRVGPKQSKGKIVLKANANAKPIKDLPIAVLGQVSINFVVKLSHASEPVFVTVTK